MSDIFPAIQASETPHVMGTVRDGRFKETGGRALNIGSSYHKGHDNHGSRPMVLDGAIPTGRVRKLTPRECERLQGFPDDWTRYNAAGQEVSDTQRYKMCGNAVTTNVVAAVVRGMRGCFA